MVMVDTPTGTVVTGGAASGSVGVPASNIRGALAMRPDLFADLAKQWLVDAKHPGIARVQTCVEVGRWEQPVGLKVTLDDGWAVLVQMVGTYPPGGGTEPPLSKDSTDYQARPEYQAGRKQAEAEAAKVGKPPRGSKPSMRAGEALCILLDVVKRANHPDITDAEVSPTTGYTVNRDYLRVTFTSGDKVIGMLAGVIPPGSTDFNHPAHEIPKEYA